MRSATFFYGVFRNLPDRFDVIAPFDCNDLTIELSFIESS